MQRERELVLGDPLPQSVSMPDASSVVALLDLGASQHATLARDPYTAHQEAASAALRLDGAATPGLLATGGGLSDFSGAGFLRLTSGRSRGEVRRIRRSWDNGTLELDGPLALNATAGDGYEILLFTSHSTQPDGAGGSQEAEWIQLHGPPLAPGQLTAVQTYSSSARLEWQQPTLCETRAGVTALCDASEVYLDAKMTHNSADFVVSGAWGDVAHVVAVNPAPAPGTALFAGLDPLSSFQVRARVRHRHVIAFGANSPVLLVKLTDNPPASTATLGLLTDLGSSDSMLLTWTIPGTLDFDTPPYVTKFMVKIGEDEAPRAGGLLAQTGRVETVIYAAELPEIKMRDYLDPATGTLMEFQRQDVCKYPVNVARRHPYAAAAVALNADALECQATVYGLEPARIYVFRVHTGNQFGFETTGSNIMFGSTISLPTVAVDDLAVESITPQENRSNYRVSLSWTRPMGWPVIERYYVSYARLTPPEYSLAGVSFRATPGGGDLGRKVLDSTLSPLSYDVDGIVKGDRYAFRVHVGNRDGVGFYPDMQNDPYVSNVVTLLVEDPPLRPRVGTAYASLPDKNTMLGLLFDPPDVGGAPTSYYAEYQECGAGAEPACSTAELAIDDPKRQLVRDSASGQLTRFSGSPVVISGLRNNTWYQVRVGASNLAGDGPLSPPSSPVRLLALPAPATGLHIESMTLASLRVGWSCAENCAGIATHFVVVYEPAAAAAAAAAGPESEVSGTRRVNATGAVTQAYFIELAVDLSDSRAQDGVMVRVYSASAQGVEDRGASLTLPGPATDLRVTSSTEFSLSFTWIPRAPADTFQLLFARPLRAGEDAASAPPMRPAAPETALSSVTVAGLLTGVRYRFSVVSKVSGVTPFGLLGSNELEAAPSGLPEPPALVRVTATFSSQVQLAWSPAATGAPPQRYRVLYARVNALGEALEPFGRPVETTALTTTVTGISFVGPWQVPALDRETVF